jgi:hypothetical protein
MSEKINKNIIKSKSKSKSRSRRERRGRREYHQMDETG